MAQIESIEDKKLRKAQIIKFVLNMVENIAGKEENAGHQHFLPFHQCFPKLSL